MMARINQFLMMGNFLSYYWLQFLVVELAECTTGNETDMDDMVRSSYRFYSDSIPSHYLKSANHLVDLRRKYKTDDFLWGGSGDGSVVSDHDGGLAWEDSGGSQGDVRGSVILVTKTMVFFKTVLTTVYPVEPTPTVIVSTAYVTRTPYLPDESPTLSLPYYSSHVTPTSLIDIEPSPTFSFPVEPTASPTPSTETNGTTDVEEIPTPAPDTFASGNPIYWVNTVIKANASEVTDQSPQFQDNMQKNLARVYASAFKRHLLNSLGLLNKSSEDGMESTLRRRRAAIQVRKKENRDYDWLFLSSPIPNGVLNSLALTAMNVSVAIVNITTEEETPKVSMEYIVLAEGKPVTAVAAVQDMRLVTKSEMESEIGYEILKKAEALLSAQPPVAQVGEAKTSPWLVMGLSLMSLMVILIILLGIVAWKWKQKRIEERRNENEERQFDSSTIERGVMNPTFVGTSSPTETVEVYQEREHKSQAQAIKPILSKKEGVRSDEPGKQRLVTQEKLSKELDTVLVEDWDQASVLIDGRGYDSAEESESESITLDSSPQLSTIVVKPAPDSIGESSKRIKKLKDKKAELGRSRIRSPRRTSPRKRVQTAVGRRKKTNTLEESKPNQTHRPLSASSREKVTFGHLDLCEEPIAKDISDEAKKIIQSRPETSKGRRGSGSGSFSKQTGRDRGIREFESTLEEELSEGGSDGNEEDFDNDNEHVELDRDIGETIETNHARRLGQPNPAPPSPRKDAQVQTPVRLRGLSKKRPKPKPRRSPSTPKISAESLISSASDEVIEVHQIHDTSTETNPLGRMRKRFHQFLDDAFNIIGKKEADGGESRTKSAKVSLTHHIETQEQSRPWTTSHVVREETLESPRPQSATLGEPKRAWTASTERRCHSASSHSSAKSRGRRIDPRISGVGHVVKERDSEDEPDQNSSPLSAVETPTSDGNQSFLSLTAPTFPSYPIYPDIPFPTSRTPFHPVDVPGTSQSEEKQDPAVPLIAAIKEEIQRFERVKVTEQHVRSRWST